MSSSPTSGPVWKPLTPRQRRVLGVLIEKAKTTPAGYPMTVNAITTGCNQKNNRDPLMTLDENDVERALDELTTLGVVQEAPIVSRVPKYRHNAYQWLGVDRAELAVMAELLLRGEQTLGELRGRAARMEPIADLAALKPLVDGLLQRGLIVEITGPGRGQMMSHNLYGDRELEEVKAKQAGRTPSAFEDDERPSHSGTSSMNMAAAPATPEVTAEMFAKLSAEVSELREQLERLREQVEAEPVRDADS